jgi:hypothetical protein
MTHEARKVLALAGVRGVSVTLGQGGETIRLHGPREALAELKPEVAAHKPDLLRLLREPRQAEVSRAWADAFARLSNTYGDDLVGSLWEIITTEHPALACAIDTAEVAADGAGLSYQRGDSADVSAFVACLATWEAAWTEAIAVVTSTTCSDCGKAARVLVTTDYGAKFCRRCLRGG